MTEMRSETVIHSAYREFYCCDGRFVVAIKWIHHAAAKSESGTARGSSTQRSCLGSCLNSFA